MNFWQRLSLPVNTFSLRHELVRRFLAPSAGDAVLDVGVGTGYSAFNFAGGVRELVGVDVAPAVVSFLASLPHPPNLRFVAADICAPESAALRPWAAHFDRIYAADVLEHVAAPGEFFRSLAFLLKPDGVALVTFPNTPGHGVTHFSRRAPLQRLIADAGLACRRCEVVKPTRWLEAIHRPFVRWPLAAHRRLRARGKTRQRPAPQTYDETFAFAFNRGRPRLRFIINLYFETLLAVAKLGPLFVTRPAGEALGADRLLLLLEKKPPPLPGASFPTP
jgi:SAM-dependent methyltransferase